MAKRVVVGISGGVDSSVAAYMLIQQGYEVIGMFMINWHDTTGTLYGDCAWKDDLVFAQLVAKKLDIPLHTVDLSEYYSKRVVDYLFSEYEKGRTPNPDVLCNREIKFDIFVTEALKLGAQFVATGHYCQKTTQNINGAEVHSLLAGNDPNKDQSYFLCQLSQQQLAPALFPIGHLLKPQVRQIAEQNNLVTASRKDSQGICFVGKVDLPVFLQQKLKSKQGNIIEINPNLEIYNKTQSINTTPQTLMEWAQPIIYKPNMGNVVGTHQGAHFFTIGQRKGLNIGGKAKPLFVIATNVEHNIVYVGQGDEHPGLYRIALFVNASETHWIRTDMKLHEGQTLNCIVRIRYRQPLQKATLHQLNTGVVILFNQAQRGITAGQFAAWYINNELIGSGVIDS